MKRRLLPTTQWNELLHQLSRGSADIADASILDNISMGDLVSEMQEMTPIVFLERRIGRKQEIGMAASGGFEYGLQKMPDATFRQVYEFTVLRHCVLVSSYDDAVSELTTTSRIQIRISGEQEDGLIVKMNRCFKLDKSPDGWFQKTITQRQSTLSEELLKASGWKFDVILPASPTA